MCMRRITKSFNNVSSGDTNVRSSVFTYQTVHTTQRMIGVVQGVGQLVHAVIGLTVAIETHTHCDAAERRGMEGQVRL